MKPYSPDGMYNKYIYYLNNSRHECVIIDIRDTYGIYLRVYRIFWRGK